MRAEGDVFYSTIQWCCPVIINLLLDPLFIYGFQMGISGAAIATLIAQLFSAGISIYYFFVRKKTPCRVTLGDIKWSGQACKEILYIGLPAFLNSLGSSLAGIVGNQILGQIGGTQAISTYTLISRIQSFLSTPFFGIMQGIQPMLGFDWGRQRFERVKRTVSYAIFSGFVYGCIIAVCIYWGAIDAALAQSPGDFAAFLSLMEAACYEVKHGRGGAVSFRTSGQERFTRLWASTLGDGYGPEDIKAAISGTGKRTGAPARKINLVVDIQAKLKAGKGPGYERWAKIFNLKQMAAALVYLQDNGLMEYGQLEQKATEATEHFHKLTEQLKTTEAAMSTNAELKAAIVKYAKTRPVFETYKAAKYSKKFLAEHEAPKHRVWGGPQQAVSDDFAARSLQRKNISEGNIRAKV